jgi:NAD(P)-dependent dehydrogenase (short-subunit alcohol dehydrogenase family)
MTVRFGLEGRYGLVCDGTSETARACVQRLCHEGMTVAFTGSGSERGETIARETGATYIECDRRDRASCDRAIELALELVGGRLDVLVTDGGPRSMGSIQATSEPDFRELLEANLTWPFRAARASLEPMRAQGAGSMIHIASDAGIRADHEYATYSVMSAGLIALAELFAAEGAPHGVRSNAVCPGEPSAVARVSGRADTADTAANVASLVAWLACDESAQMNGATLRIDGASGAAIVADTRG